MFKKPLYETSKELTLREESRCEFVFWDLTHWKLARAPGSSTSERIKARRKYGVGRWLKQKSLEGLIETFEGKLLKFLW